MQDRPPRRPLIRLGNAVTILLLLALVTALAWLGNQHARQFDWTRNGRNTLSPISARLLKTLQSPPQITAFVGANQLLRSRIKELVGRYQRLEPAIELHIIDPDQDPQQARDLGIRQAGTLIVAIDGRSEKVRQLNEQSLTSALYRLAHRGDRQLAWVRGHGERALDGRANQDLGQLGTTLEEKGFLLHPLDLTATQTIPDNTAVLILASPRIPLLGQETQAILDYLERGGNLLWLREPKEPKGLEPLEKALALHKLPGVVVDAESRDQGLSDPSTLILRRYPQHPVTQGLDALTLFPQSAALETTGQPDAATPLAQSSERSWNETAPLAGQIQPNPEQGERRGPLDLALAIEHPNPGTTSPTPQRIIVTGDGDFLSNRFLGNGGNLDLGQRMILWLTNEDVLIQLPKRPQNDRLLDLSDFDRALIGGASLFGLPLLFLAIGIGIWGIRRRQ